MNATPYTVRFERADEWQRRVHYVHCENEGAARIVAAALKQHKIGEQELNLDVTIWLGMREIK